MGLPATIEWTPTHSSKLLNLYVTEYQLFGKPPTPENAAKYLKVPVSTVLKAVSSDEFQTRLSRRGITLSEDSTLTEQQIAVANVMLDFTDTRTQAAKLRACGINSMTFQGWLETNPIFNQYMRRRAENIIDGQAVSAAHVALMQQVTRGNMQAIKLTYELTGRHKDSTSLNVEYFLQRVIETVAMHVKDQDTLKKIAEDFTILMEETKGP